MKASTGLLLALAGLALGLALGVGLAQWHYSERVRIWQQRVEDQQRADSLEVHQQAVRDTIDAANRDTIARERARGADLAAENARLRGRLRPVAVPALPVAGLVPVDSVRPIIAELVEQVALRDSAIEVADSLHASDQRQLAGWERAYTVMADSYVQAELGRQHWKHLAETAPVRRDRPRLLGVPLPELHLTAGAQVGVGACTTPVGLQSCGYAGAGLTLGVGYRL